VINKEDLKIELRNKWRKKYLSPQNVDENKLREGINWLYSLGTEPSPKIIIVDGLLEAQIVANVISENVDLLNEDIPVKELLKMWPENTPMQYYNFSYNGSILDYSWLSQFDYYNNIGINFGPHQDLLDNFKNLMILGIYDMIQFRGLVIAIRMPKYIKLDDRNRLHCIDGAAVEFLTGEKFYYINGIELSEEIVCTPGDELDPFLVVKESNAEKRMAIAFKIGPHRLYEKLNKKSLEKITGIDLYKSNPIGNYYQHGDVLIKPDQVENVKFENLSTNMIKRLNNVFYELVELDLGKIGNKNFLVMKNPSTGSTHIEGVPNEITTVFEAIKFRNQTMYLPHIIT